MCNKFLDYCTVLGMSLASFSCILRLTLFFYIFLNLIPYNVATTAYPIIAKGLNTDASNHISFPFNYSYFVVLFVTTKLIDLLRTKTECNLPNAFN